MAATHLCIWSHEFIYCPWYIVCSGINTVNFKIFVWNAFSFLGDTNPQKFNTRPHCHCMHVMTITCTVAVFTFLKFVKIKTVKL